MLTGMQVCIALITPIPPSLPFLMFRTDHLHGTATSSRRLLTRHVPPTRRQLPARQGNSLPRAFLPPARRSGARLLSARASPRVRRPSARRPTHVPPPPALISTTQTPTPAACPPAVRIPSSRSRSFSCLHRIRLVRQRQHPRARHLLKERGRRRQGVPAHRHSSSRLPVTNRRVGPRTAHNGLRTIRLSHWPRSSMSTGRGRLGAKSSRRKRAPSELTSVCVELTTLCGRSGLDNRYEVRR